MALSLSSSVALRRGGRIPLFGLGTWLSRDGGAKTSIASALAHGYRLIDTATMYENEAEVGEALAAWTGEPPYLVTKLTDADHSRDAALAAIDASLAKLGAPVDLWLMHSPGGGKVVETWRAMLEARDAGKCKAVGVSNFGVAQLRALHAAGLEAPEVNQIELHVFNQQRPTVAYCREQGIVMMAFCPLGRCKLVGQTELAQLAAELGRTEAEMMIRWLLQQGHVTIPKSVSAARIAQNAAFGFELSAEVAARIDGLDQGFLASNAAKAMERPWAEVE